MNCTETSMPDIANIGTNISSDFKNIENLLSKYTISSFHNIDLIEQYLLDFNLKNLFSELEVDRLKTRTNDMERSVVAFEQKPYEPKFSDLCRLHYLTLQRKFINILELGSGFSTVIMADALRILNEHFKCWTQKNIRCQVPFHIFSVDEDQRFLEITRMRLGIELSSFATISRSNVELITFDNRFATIYSKLPNISPDFIYLDGPSQFGTVAELNGFSLNCSSRAPMSADILRIEFFLEPGTLILVDGRTQNARFLKVYLKRNWVYYHDQIDNIHYFELHESPLGPYNKKKMDFCLGGRWLLS